MMEFIMVPAIMAIVTLGVYKLFELFVCKKERLTIIEKMGDKFSPDMLERKMNFSSIGNFSFSALKIGCLLVGMGLGLLVGYLICTTTVVGYSNYSIEEWRYRETISLIYGACVLLFGGIGLITAFIVELKYNKK
ncbi:hypothetical protein FQ707_12825 [Bacteroidaceae bacterium HV4-6-C5C]|nr:hypothetical protein FQ707_12825 [Bacteroidaceae bacterium HV4-6-C5C]